MTVAIPSKTQQFILLLMTSELPAIAASALQGHSPEMGHRHRFSEG